MPTETIGRYEVGDSIGRGAMAVVYRAVDPTIGRTVALKTMRFDVHGIEHNEVLSRFRNEARAAGKLLHPNLVTIYDAGEQEGTFYIAMECVEGSTLQALLSEQRFLTLDRTVDILTQICAGLDYAHAAGVVHRDIKPANIMVTSSGVVKIMDFGIAKSGTQLTTAGAVLGTPNYISPEMVKGEEVDGRSDLFSVAVILHEMLLGERPFIAPNISTIIYKIVNEPLSPDLETRVHPAVAAILRKALSKHPSDRLPDGRGPGRGFEELPGDAHGLHANQRGARHAGPSEPDFKFLCCRQHCGGFYAGSQGIRYALHQAAGSAFRGSGGVRYERALGVPDDHQSWGRAGAGRDDSET